MNTTLDYLCLSAVVFVMTLCSLLLRDWLRERQDAKARTKEAEEELKRIAELTSESRALRSYVDDEEITITAVEAEPSPEQKLGRVLDHRTKFRRSEPPGGAA